VSKTTIWIIIGAVVCVLIGAIVTWELIREPDPMDPPPPPEDTTHPHPPVDPHMCKAACDRMHDLGCPEGEDVQACEMFCVETLAQGHGLNPTCIAEIGDCAGVKECTENPR